MDVRDLKGLTKTMICKQLNTTAQKQKQDESQFMMVEFQNVITYVSLEADIFYQTASITMGTICSAFLCISC